MSIELKMVRDELRETAANADNGHDAAWATRLADTIDAEIRRMEGAQVYGYVYGNRLWGVGNPRLPGDAKEYGTKLYTQPPRAGVPDGWKLVPIEPSPEMIRRGFGAFMAAHDEMFCKNEPIAPIWRCMLSAAPCDPSSQGGEVPHGN